MSEQVPAAAPLFTILPDASRAIDAGAYLKQRRPAQDAARTLAQLNHPHIAAIHGRELAFMFRASALGLSAVTANGAPARDAVYH